MSWDVISRRDGGKRVEQWRMGRLPTEVVATGAGCKEEPAGEDPAQVVQLCQVQEEAAHPDPSHVDADGKTIGSIGSPACWLQILGFLG